jgi:release factor glutamine methyltransferase
VIISSPPSFPGEPRDIADRAWHAGPSYRDIVPLFDQAWQRLLPGGRVYLLVSSDSDLDLFGTLIARARFEARVVAERSIVIESLIIYELRRFGGTPLAGQSQRQGLATPPWRAAGTLGAPLPGRQGPGE